MVCYTLLHRTMFIFMLQHYKTHRLKFIIDSYITGIITAHQTVENKIIVVGLYCVLSVRKLTIVLP